MKIKFAKMTGAGNDFVVIDNRSGKVKNGSRLARRVCARRWGIGADGLLLLEKSRRAAYRMMYYNSDGSYGGMCGNGGRCIAWYAFKKGIAPREHSFEALGHIYAAKVTDKQVALRMKDPKDLKPSVKLNLRGKRVDVAFVDTGSPHAVVLAKKLTGRAGTFTRLDVTDWGRLIRYHRSFYPRGTNVNFVEAAGRNSLRIRTYERGVEDETLACGTGSIASAIVACELWGYKSPVTVIPRSKKNLIVRFTRASGRFQNVELSGPAELIFEAFIEV
jgi:diaminopimelate epimerase